MLRLIQIISNCEDSSKWSYTIVILVFYFLCLNSYTQELKPSFTLDTAKTQVFPFDLDFNLKLVSPKNKPYRAIYLYRLDKNGDLVFDKNTSYKKFKWTSDYNRDLAEKSIAIDSTAAKNYLESFKNEITVWRKKLEKLKAKEIELKALPNSKETTKELECLLKEIYGLKYDIEKYDKSDSLINYHLTKRKKLIVKLKNFPSITPLEQVNRIKDTLIVRVEPLKPNRRYLIVALDYLNKTKVLAKLVKEFDACGEFGEHRASIVPKERVSHKQWKELSVKVSPKLLKRRIPIIKNLLNEYNEKLSLSHFFPKDFPGAYPYPTDLIGNRLLTDSLYILPEDASQDFRELNALIVTSKKHGDDLVTGKGKLELDKSKRIDMSFKPETDLTERRKNIVHHLNIATRAKQSLYVLESSDSIITIYENYLESFVDILEENKLCIDEKVKKQNDINSQLQKELIPIGQNFTTLEKTTHSYQFLTRNSRLIKPDFGILYYRSDEGFQGVAPFAGFHFGIRSRDENIPFGQIPGWEKYLSFQIGVPFFAESLIEDGRRKHLVGDTFSLYGGVGININHAIRITYGGLFFRGIDSNKSGEGTFKIKTAPAVSVSINLKLRSLFEGLYGSINSLNPNK